MFWCFVLKNVLKKQSTLVGFVIKENSLPIFSKPNISDLLRTRTLAVEMRNQLRQCHETNENPSLENAFCFVLFETNP